MSYDTLETAAALTHGKGGVARTFTLFEGALLMREFGDEIRPALPPLPVQRIVFLILATVGRILGYRLAPIK